VLPAGSTLTKYHILAHVSSITYILHRRQL